MAESICILGQRHLTDREPYVWLRLYGLEKAFWNKPFKMPDVELVKFALYQSS